MRWANSFYEGVPKTDEAWRNVEMTYVRGGIDDWSKLVDAIKAYAAASVREAARLAVEEAERRFRGPDVGMKAGDYYQEVLEEIASGKLDALLHPERGKA